MHRPWEQANRSLCVRSGCNCGYNKILKIFFVYFLQKLILLFLKKEAKNF